jgi:hypothetical protein
VESDIPCKWKLNAAGIGTLISDKIDFKPKLFRRDKESHYILMRGNNPLRRYSNYKYICTKPWCLQFLQTNTTRHKGTNRS